MMREEKRKAAARPPKIDNVVRVTFEDYDAENWFVLFEKNGENIALEFGICEFPEEMTHWDIPARAVVRNGRPGFAVSKAVRKEDIMFEIRRFIQTYSLGECEW